MVQLHADPEGRWRAWDLTRAPARELTRPNSPPDAPESLDDAVRRALELRNYVNQVREGLRSQIARIEAGETMISGVPAGDPDQLRERLHAWDRRTPAIDAEAEELIARQRARQADPTLPGPSLGDPPKFLTRLLGDPPEAGDARRAWTVAASLIEGYRSRWRMMNDKTTLGRLPEDPVQARDRHAVIAEVRRLRRTIRRSRELAEGRGLEVSAPYRSDSPRDLSR